MIKYDIDTINRLINQNNITIDDSNIINMLSNINNNQNFNNNSTNFNNDKKFNNVKNKFIHNNTPNTNNSIKNTTNTDTNTNTNTNTDKNTETNSYIKNTNTVLRLINKISKSNYSSIKSEIICYYNISKTHELAVNIYNILSKNIFLSDIYSQLYIDLINIDNIFYKILIKDFENAVEILDNIMIPSNINDEITANTNNDKINSKFLFYINLSKQNVINFDSIVDLILSIQLCLIDKLKYENYKLSEYISSYIFLFINNLHDKIKLHDKYNTIIHNINIIKMYNNESTNINYKLYINNKIKFKHYDMYDKLKKI